VLYKYYYAVCRPCLRRSRQYLTSKILIKLVVITSGLEGHKDSLNSLSFLKYVVQYRKPGLDVGVRLAGTFARVGKIDELEACDERQGLLNRLLANPHCLPFF
jgi:hypothetical protein